MKFHISSFSRMREIYQNKHEPEAAHILLCALWRTTLIAAIFVMLAGVWQGAKTLSKTFSALEQAKNDTTAPKSPLDRSMLDATLAGFDARAERFETLKSASTTVADPSI